MNDVSSGVLESLRRALRRVAPASMYGRLSGALDGVATLQRAGWVNAKKLREARTAASAELVILDLPQLDHPLAIRAGTSDAEEVTYTVIRKAYGAIRPPKPVTFVVDAGANIGDSTAWYLSTYPQARVVALEPDDENFGMLARNCAPYGDRAVLLKAGLWPRDASLRVSGGAKTALTVSEVPPETAGACPARSLISILKETGAEQIDVLKCDIEGAETRLFSEGPDEWLARTRSVYIELHGQAAEEAVFAAMRRHRFRHRVHRNLHVFTRKV